ncbi:membrane protein insertion efficiency factor YidD [Microbacterium protaetiae]|uniref:Putative membrane protein insertion efficiency factor n=1 Tax=Microbacterium protaetiae TaxID=2509458 RepID=A0A4P6EJC9_9MICO|nr:membrane protein insertion efficiency factor YidD [Microbacterium protaetiae]QAY61753.1 membrane protein insertion efficiency factor YidD [Microbacterium protaetiae]
MRGTALWRMLPLIPRDVVLTLLHAYRATVSHAYGDVCRYYPTCSAYAVGAVQQHGAVKGAGLAAWRILRCHPWAAGGVDDVPPSRHFHFELTPHGFVVPPRKD